MIIKSKTYKTFKSFRTVTAYILRESEQENSFVLTRFIRGKKDEIENLAKQLEANEQYRKHKRKNNIKLYMDILSFHAGDSAELTNEKLQKIAKKYIQLRAPKAISIATVHRQEKDHVHLHVLFSGANYRTGEALRISKAEFKEVKQQSEAYVRKEFPELAFSAINHGKVSQKRINDAELHLQQKGKLSQKQQALTMLERAFKKANSKQQFFELIGKGGLSLYKRGGHIVGIELNRRHRFSTLGYTEEFLNQLSIDLTKQKRLELILKMREKQARSRSRTRDR